MRRPNGAATAGRSGAGKTKDKIEHVTSRDFVLPDSADVLAIGDVLTVLKGDFRQ